MDGSKKITSDTQAVEVLITLADFNIWWGV